MKSIVEQGKSVLKAIEKAWNRAGNPEDFSIKIFEKEKKNFFGFTSKPAKIGIFFEGEKTITRREPSAKKFESNRFHKQKQESAERREKQSFSKKQAIWQDPMIHAATNWVKASLTIMGMPNINFKTHVANRNLFFEFSEPIFDDGDKEKILFRTFAHLIMTTLQGKFKNELRNLKIVFVRL